MRFLRTTQNPLLRNVASLVVATAIAQAVQLGVTPFLTRIYGPDEFAVFQVFFSTAAVISVIATLRYEFAIVATDRQIEARPLVFGSLGISIVMAMIVFTTMATIHLSGLFKIPPFYIWTVPIFIALSGTSQSFTNISIRSGTFQLNFWSRISSSIVQAITALLFGLYGALSTGLMMSIVAGQLIWVLILGQAFRFRTQKAEEKIDLNGIFQVLKRHQKFPRYNAPHALIDVLQDHGVIFLLGIFFENAIMAFYGQAYRLLKAPVGFIGSAIHQVYYPDFSRRLQTGENLRPLLTRMYLHLFLLGLPFFAAIAWYAVPLFTWLLGSDWSDVGRIAQALSPWLLLNFVVSPFDGIPLILSRQGTAMLIAAIEFIIRVLAILIGGFYFDPNTSFVLIGISGAFFSIFKLYWYYQLGDNKLAK